MFNKLLTLILFIAVSTFSLTSCSTSSDSADGSGSEEGYDYTLGNDFADSAMAGHENPELAARLDGGNIPSPGAEGSGKFKDVRFAFDSSKLTPDSAYTVKEVAAHLATNPNMVVELEGHCDKRGTSEYNLALGNLRARAVAAALVKEGVAAKRITTVSYGAEIPLDPAATEAAFALNRRVHFVIYTK